MPQTYAKIKKPILEHIIDKAKKENFTNIYISTHYKPEVIENYFGDGSKFDVKITYIKKNLLERVAVLNL